jgi:predicted DCC family thiol-disulfide oxidoreductase YuxK
MGAIVLFDGVCNVCDASVQFIIEHDPKAYFKFAPLQSDAGRELAAKFGLSAAVANVGTSDNGLIPIDSVILIEDDKVYTHSSAALRIASELEGAWSWLRVLGIVPAFVRDWAYKLFARYRYRFFGQKESCMIPTPDVRARFLD